MTTAGTAFSPRSDILDPLAVVGVGPVARALADRLLRLTDDQLLGLRGLVGDDLLLVLGQTEALPWVDGVEYLGRDPGAPRLLIPAMLRPVVALDVFERAIARHASTIASPWAVLVSPARLISVADARPIERRLLEAWLGAKP